MRKSDQESAAGRQGSMTRPQKWRRLSLWRKKKSQCRDGTICPGMDMERIFFEEDEGEGKFIGLK